MKKMILLIVLLFSANSMAFEPSCETPLEREDVVELLVDRCLGEEPSEAKTESLMEKISLEDEAEAAYYTDLYIYFGKELIGFQTLFSSSVPGCQNEELFELSCPEDLK